MTSTSEQSEQSTAALAYCRSVYGSSIDWYKVSDLKGQLLLTLDGAFVTVMANAILRNPGDIAIFRSHQNPVTWGFISAAIAAITVSIACGIMCLRSRLSNASIERHLQEFMEGETYRPVATFWFGTLARMPAEVSRSMLRGATQDFELEAICDEIILLSKNVLAKHRWVNTGWVAAGFSLILVVAASAGIVVSASAEAVSIIT